MDQCTRFWNVSHQRAAKVHTNLRIAQTGKSLRCSHTRSMNGVEGSHQPLGLELHWIGKHVRLLEALSSSVSCTGLEFLILAI